MSFFFLKRGYSIHLLDTAVQKASFPHRDTLKLPARQNSTTKLGTLQSVILYLLQSNPETSYIFTDNPLVSFQHSRLFNTHAQRSETKLIITSKCPLLHECFPQSQHPNSRPKSDFVIRDHFKCTFSNITYCTVSCSKCCELYINETGRCL